MSNNEISYSIMTIGLLMLVMGFVIHIVFLVICLSFLLLYPVNLYVSKWVSRNLPGMCRRNIFGLIEVHVGSLCNANRFKYTQICTEAILFAIKENRNVLIDTWLTTKEKMKLRYEDAVEFKEPRIFQKIANNRIERKFHKRIDQKSIRFIIYVSRLTEDQIKRLETDLARLSDRGNRMNNTKDQW